MMGSNMEDRRHGMQVGQQTLPETSSYTTNIFNFTSDETLPYTLIDQRL
jgi:hypothetical protein